MTIIKHIPDSLRRALFGRKPLFRKIDTKITIKPIYHEKLRHPYYLSDIAVRLINSSIPTKRILRADFFAPNVNPDTYASLPPFPSGGKDLVAFVNLRAQLAMEKMAVKDKAKAKAKERQQAEVAMILQQMAEIDAKRGAFIVGLEKGWVWM